MNYLAILAEDDSDEWFYEACAERISGLSFSLHPSKRIRKNGGVSAVRSVLPAFLNDLKGLSQMGDTFFIISLDNDRAREHPDHGLINGISERDRSRQCRVCELNKAITKVFGANMGDWPAKGVIGVPVQMLESWVLQGMQTEKLELPLFSRKDSSSARKFYSGPPPDQLKDLCKTLKENQEVATDSELFLKVAGDFDIESLCENSASFKQFTKQVRKWREP